MRRTLLRFVVVGVIAVAGCGGDEEAEPLTMEQRVLLESEAPGSEPDPQETRVSADSLDEFVALPEYVQAARVERSEYEEAGLVAAVNDTRFYPSEPGAEHTGHEPHVRLLVLQFESGEGANEAVDFLHENGVKPCPGSCATRASEFEVDGTPDARGARRITTAEELEETGEEGEPFDSWSIRFADGRYAYELEIFGDPGTVSEEQVEEIAEALHDRVEGAPPPS